MKKFSPEKWAFQYLVPTLEYILIYGLIYSYLWEKLSFLSIYSILLFSGITLSLFYKFRGASVSSLMLFSAILKKNSFNVLNFNQEDIIIGILGVSAILITGYAKSTLSRNVSLLQEGNEMLVQRKDQLLSEIISVDLSYRKFMEDTYFKNIEPSYLYFELRKSAVNIQNVVEFSAKIFSILNRYLFVEAGAIYQKKENDLEAIFHYGVSTLPKEFKENNLPNWHEIISTEEKVIFSRIPERHGLLIIIPVFSHWINELQYVFVIEKIRFVMLNPKTYTNLRVVSLMIKLIFEVKLFHQEITKLSILPNVLVYNEEVSAEILKRRIDFFRSSQIPFQLLVISDEEITIDQLKPSLSEIEMKTRLFDEKFYINNQIILLFPFAETAIPIIKHLSQIKHLESLKVVEEYELKKFLFLAG